MIFVIKSRLNVFDYQFVMGLKRPVEQVLQNNQFQLQNYYPFILT